MKNLPILLYPGNIYQKFHRMKKIILSIAGLTLGFLLFAQSSDELITLSSATGDLKGTLVVPDAVKKFNLVILQPGSGPTDRNGNNPLGVKAKSYRLLADELAKNKIASLLIDKRGIGASSKSGRAEADMRFDDYVNDLTGWVELMKKDKRVKKLIIAGHSEGSLVGMIAAQKTKIDKYISIAGIADPIDKVISWQLKQQSPQTSLLADSLFARLREGKKLDSVPPALFMLLRPSVQPYMASWMKYNPCEEIKKIKIPVLILQGSTDIQVKEEEGHKLQGCKPKCLLVIINGMNHVLKEAPADRKKNMDTYMDEKLPVVPRLVEEITKFVK